MKISVSHNSNGVKFTCICGFELQSEVVGKQLKALKNKLEKQHSNCMEQSKIKF